jgi:serine/threonine protein phosphatase PrpC
VKIHAFGASDLGRERTLNEDAYACDPARGVFIVCDGMGGHAAGEVASKHTVRGVHKAVTDAAALVDAVRSGAATAESLVPILRTAVEQACAEIHDEGVRDKAKRGMGTTCTALLLAGNQGVIAHVGDSRMMILRGGVLTQLTQDHTYVAEAIRTGLLKPEDAEKSPFGNVVTRAVGPQRNVMVDTLVFDVVDGDTMLLCSDGLHQYTPNPVELAKMLEGENTELVVKQLITLANERGGSDNISAIIVRVPTVAPAEQKDSNAVTDIDTLRHIDLVREMSMSEVVRLSQAFRKIRIEPGEFVLREGESSDMFYVLLEGRVEITRNNQRVNILPKGSHFGEMAILSLRPRSASVRTLEACRLLVAQREELYQFLQAEPMLAAKFFWKLAQTLSLRLDEFYVAADRPPEVNMRNTLRFGHYPSPFGGPTGSSDDE